MQAALSRVVNTTWSIWSIIDLDDSHLPQPLNLRVGIADFLQELVRMLAELRRFGSNAARSGRELRNDPRHLERLAVARGDVLDHAARGEVRIGSDVRRAVNATGGHLGLLHRGKNVGLRALRGPFADRRIDALHLRRAAVVPRQRRVVAQVGTPDRRHQALIETVGVAGDKHVAVGARVEIRRRNAGQRTAASLAHVFLRVELRQQALHAIEHRLVERDVDHLARAALLHCMQGEKCADHAVERSNRVAERKIRPRRRPVREAVHIAQSADGFGDGSESRALLVRAGLAIAGNAHQHQFRIGARQLLPSQVPALERARPEILDHDMRVAREAPHDLLAFELAQVARHRLLVARLHVPPERRAVPHPPPLAQRVAFARRLDLDHLRAEVAERLRAERPGDERAELDDPNAGEGSYLSFKSRRGLYSSTVSPRWFLTLMAKRTRPRSPFEVRRCSITSASTWIVSPASVGPFTSSVALRNASPVSCIVGKSNPSAKEYTRAAGTARPLMARAESSSTVKSSSVSQLTLTKLERSASAMVRRGGRKRKPRRKSSKQNPRPTMGRTSAAMAVAFYLHA